jgi:uncharacterized protein (DUF2141 family)
MKANKFYSFLLATLTSISLTNTVKAESTETLTVLVNGIQHQKGQLCLGVYSSEKGFPFSTNTVVKSGCIKITGSTLKKQFLGLKPGNYAVAVVDDQNGDRKLNQDIFGIPQEGFGISQNPTVSIQTGAPRFRNASFVMSRNTTVNIIMKYSLDP